MNEEFEPNKFVELLKNDFLNLKDKEKTERYFIILKDFLGDIYYNSEPFEKDKRKKPRDKLLFVEDKLNKIEDDLKTLLSEDSLKELKKLFSQIKERNDSPFGPEINFIWNSAEIGNLSEETLVLLKKLQKEVLPEVYLPYAIDSD